MELAVDEARSTLNRLDSVAGSLAGILRGRLRSVKSGYILEGLKRELQKFNKSVESGTKILMLVPASVGSNWYRDFVFRKAQTVFINGRIKFLGQMQPYPKDLMLCVFGFDQYDFEVWTPKKEELS